MGRGGAEELVEKNLSLSAKMVLVSEIRPSFQRHANWNFFSFKNNNVATAIAISVMRSFVIQNKTLK